MKQKGTSSLECELKMDFSVLMGDRLCRMLKKELALAPAVALGQLTRG